MSLFVLLNTKEDILKNVGSQTVDGRPNHSIVGKNNGSQWVWLPTSKYIYIFFCVQR